MYPKLKSSLGVFFFLSSLVFADGCNTTQDNAIGKFYDSTNPGSKASNSDIVAYVHGLMYGCEEKVRGSEEMRKAFCECMKSVVIDNMINKLTGEQAKEVIRASAYAKQGFQMPYQEIVFSEVREKCGHFY